MTTLRLLNLFIFGGIQNPLAFQITEPKLIFDYVINQSSPKFASVYVTRTQFILFIFDQEISSLKYYGFLYDHQGSIFTVTYLTGLKCLSFETRLIYIRRPIQFLSPPFIQDYFTAEATHFHLYPFEAGTEANDPEFFFEVWEVGGYNIRVHVVNDINTGNSRLAILDSFDGHCRYMVKTPE